MHFPPGFSEQYRSSNGAISTIAYGSSGSKSTMSGGGGRSGGGGAGGGGCRGGGGDGGKAGAKKKPKSRARAGSGTPERLEDDPTLAAANVEVLKAQKAFEKAQLRQQAA